MDVIYLLNFSACKVTRSLAVHELDGRIREFLLSTPQPGIVETVLRMIHSILEVRDLLSSQHICTRIIICLLPVLRDLCVKAIETGLVDSRELILRFIIGVLKFTDPCYVAQNLQGRVLQCLTSVQLADKHVSRYYLQLLASIDVVERYQELVGAFEHFGELERDIWHLGIIKGWIRLD